MVADDTSAKASASAWSVTRCGHARSLMSQPLGVPPALVE